MKLILPIVLILVLLYSCGDGVVNSESHVAFDEKGTLVAEFENLEINSTDSIYFYIEASGSMNGFFRGNKPTLLKKDLWAVISDFPKTDSVLLFEKMNAPPSLMALANFRTQMNAGSLTSSYATDIPTMLKTILSDLDKSRSRIAVLVSDLKYSPVGSGPQAVLLDQYQTEIRNLFRDRNYAINLIGAKSDFLSKNGKVQCETSPYYYLIIGKSEYVTSVSDRIVDNLQATGDFLGDVAYNIDYKTPRYTALPYKNVSNMQNVLAEKGCYTFTNYDETKEGAQLWIALNVKQLPREVRSAENIRALLETKGTYGSVVKIEEITNLLDLGNASDKKFAQLIDADLFVKVSVQNMIMESEVIELNINDQVADLSWSEPFLDAEDEADCSKTYSLKEFLNGLKSGTKQYHYQEKPIYILISKKNI